MFVFPTTFDTLRETGNWDETRRTTNLPMDRYGDHLETQLHHRLGERILAGRCENGNRPYTVDTLRKRSESNNQTQDSNTRGHVSVNPFGLGSTSVSPINVPSCV